MLYIQIGRDFELSDAHGRKIPAMKVFGEVINYLKAHLLGALKKRGTMVDNKDIHWVLTVPAIWADFAKQFMRESAYSVCIHMVHIIKQNFTLFQQYRKYMNLFS